MPTFLNIQPTELIQVISKIEICILHIELNLSATVQVLAYSEENQLLKSYIFELVLPEYSSWQNDDFLVDYVCQKYGFILNTPYVQHLNIQE